MIHLSRKMGAIADAVERQTLAGSESCHFQIGIRKADLMAPELAEV
jgi:hypothetical protein